MKARLALIALLSVGATAATAQEHVGTDMAGGLAWHVSAPRGASWTLVCGFNPVRYEVNAYNRNAWSNRMSTRGAGPQSGRLPGGDGRCTLTKTGGDGPVALALAKNGQPTAAATNDPAAPAKVSVF